MSWQAMLWFVSAAKVTECAEAEAKGKLILDFPFNSELFFREVEIQDHKDETVG